MVAGLERSTHWAPTSSGLKKVSNKSASSPGIAYSHKWDWSSSLGWRFTPRHGNMLLMRASVVANSDHPLTNLQRAGLASMAHGVRIM